MPSREPEGLDYASLFNKGVTLAQTLASDQWTDYNLHDPGVTILQQLCYALTDLVYRTGYDDADLFIPRRAENDGEEKTTFFRGPDILTGAPVTHRDCRTLLYGQIEDVENAWLRRADDGRKIKGLYEIDVQPLAADERQDKSAADSYRSGLRRKVQSNYLSTRPLCEDVAEIRILRPLLVTVAAEIEIDDSQSADDIAANIIYALQQNLIPAPSYASIQSELDLGRRYDEIFEGPAMDILVDNQTPDGRPRRLTTDQFLKIATRADGVRSIRKLTVEAEGQPDTATAGLTWGPDYFPTISVRKMFPTGQPNGQQARPSLNLWFANLLQTLHGDRIANTVEHLKYMQHEGLASKLQSIKADPYNSLPFGVDRSLEAYTSIREQFPQVYGLGQYGAPSAYFLSANENIDLRRSANVKARQLKAYLLIFEQFLVNYLSQLKNLPRLFSLEADAGSTTYFHQRIQKLSVEGALSINDVLPPDAADPGASEPVASLVVAPYRDQDRRERLLNHLLARFNEAFDDVKWTRVREAGCRTASDVDDMFVFRNNWKTVFLEHYVFNSGFRGAGIDYSKGFGAAGDRDPQPAGIAGSGAKPIVAMKSGAAAPKPIDLKSKRTNPAAGLQRRVKSLTGVSELYVIEHILLRNRMKTADGDWADLNPPGSGDFYSLQVSVVAPLDAIQPQPAMRSFIERAVEDNCPAHIDARCLFLPAHVMNQFRSLYSGWRDAYAKAFGQVEKASDAALGDLDRQSDPLRKLLMEQANVSGA